jgi:LEA14-like dessication related protein
MVTFGIVFHNPNKFGCTISDIESEGSINSKLVFNAGVISKVKAKAGSDVTFPVTANLAKMELSQLLGTGLNLLLNDEAIPMQVKGKLKVRKFIFCKTYHFDYTQSIDKAWLRKLF